MSFQTLIISVYLLHPHTLNWIINSGIREQRGTNSGQWLYMCFLCWSLEGDKVQTSFHVTLKWITAQLVKSYSVKALNLEHD